MTKITFFFFFLESNDENNIFCPNIIGKYLNI